MRTLFRFLCQIEFHHGPIILKGRIALKQRGYESPFPFEIAYQARQCQFCKIPFATNSDLLWSFKDQAVVNGQ